MTMSKMKWKRMLAGLFVACAFAGSAVAQSGPSWGPETPNFNLQVILRGEGFGHVSFRQPNDDALTIHLDVWVRDLAPNTSYLLQRAVDDIVDDNCTSTNWLTLGKGLTPQSITTDAEGKGKEEVTKESAHQLIEEAQLFVDAAYACYGRMVQANQPTAAQ